MAEVGSAFVSILPSAKGFGRKLDSEVGGELDDAGKKGGKKFGAAFKVGALAAVGGAALVGNFLKGAVDQASDLQESGTKIAAIFGRDGSAAVQKFADQGATALGQTRLAVLDASATFGTFGKAAGLGGKELAKFSTGFASLSTDLASFYNTSPEEAVEAIGAALRGEAEPIRKYGVLLDDATLRQETLRLGLIKTTKDALTPQQKVLAAQAAIYKQTKDAQGDFQKTSGGLANQQRILSAQWSDMKTTVGAGLLPVVTRFVTFLNNTGLPAIIKIGTGIKQFGAFVAPFVERIKGMFNSLGGGTSSLGAFGNAASAVVNAFRTMQATISPIVLAVVNTIRANWGPISGWVSQHFGKVRDIITGVMGIVARVVTIHAKLIRAVWQVFGADILKIASAAFKMIGGVISGAMSIIAGIVKTVLAILKGDWSGAWNGIKQILSGALKIIVSIVKGAFSVAVAVVGAAMRMIVAAAKAGTSALISFVASLPGRIKSGLGSLGSLLYSAGMDLIRGLMNGIKAMAGSVADAARDVVGSAIDAAKKKLGIASPSKVFRRIGVWIGQGLEGGVKSRTKAVRKVGVALANALRGGIEGKEMKVVRRSLNGIDKLLAGLGKKGIKAVAPTFAKLRERISNMAKSARESFKSMQATSREFASSVAETFKNDIFGNGAAGLKLQLQADTNDARAMTKALRTASAKGLSGSFEKALAQSGDLTTAQQISKMTRTEIARLERLYAERNKATQQLGNFAANQAYGARERELFQTMRETQRVLNNLPRSVREGARDGIEGRNKKAGARRKAGR